MNPDTNNIHAPIKTSYGVVKRLARLKHAKQVEEAFM